MFSHLRPGDVVEIGFSWGTHPGIVVGRDWAGRTCVAHSSRRIGHVAVETIAEFAQGRSIRVQWRAPANAGRAIAIRAAARIGERWSFKNANCEDFVTSVIEGRAHSPQRDRLVEGAKLAGIALSVVALVRLVDTVTSRPKPRAA